jgi:uncharacterized protein YdhG (YjbR/CyaY superfamily)
MAKLSAQSIDEYIAQFPASSQALLQTLRQTIQRVVPEATEHISYAIPTFKLRGKMLLCFAGYKHHLAVYPAPLEHPDFAAACKPYASGKGTARFALDAPLPLELVASIALHQQARLGSPSSEKKRTIPKL